MKLNSRVCFAIAAVAALAADQSSKALVSSRMAGGEVLDVIHGVLRLSYVRNTGAVFGILSATPNPFKEVVLGLIAVAALAIMVFYFVHYPLDRKLFHTGLGLVFGGAAGNILDRLTRGFVVDFIDVHFKDRFTWPTFNVADCAICIGIVLMIVDMQAGRDRRTKRARHAA